MRELDEAEIASAAAVRAILAFVNAELKGQFSAGLEIEASAALQYAIKSAITERLSLLLDPG